MARAADRFGLGDTTFDALVRSDLQVTGPSYFGPSVLCQEWVYRLFPFRPILLKNPWNF